jgi:hypothetical protein
MEKIFINLPTDIISVIINNLTTQSEEDYWMNFYKKIFSQNVLSYIDQEFKLVGITQYTICETCIQTEFNNNCTNCTLLMPCLNCYFDENCCLNCEEYLSNRDFHLISWKQIQGLMNDVLPDCNSGNLEPLQFKSFKEFKSESKKRDYYFNFMKENIIPLIQKV